MEAINLLDAEFKALVLKMLNKVRGRIDDFSENINKEIGSVKKEMKSVKNNHK